MIIEDFTENKIVLLLIEELKELKEEDPERFKVSDIYDDQGNYYVDLVQEGGGVLGVALLGYTYVLEQMGIRFLKMAGTSAGAINTVLVASAGKPQEERSKKVIKYLANTNLYSFVDGDSDARDFIKTLNKGSGFVKLVYNGLQILDNLEGDMGLNPGNSFLEWMEGILREMGIETVADLRKRVYDLPDEVLAKIYPQSRIGQSMDLNDWPVAMIAADITTETKAIFPQMGHLYLREPDKVNPAYFVRASMSIPIFFHPVKLEAIPDDPACKLAWEEITNYIGPHPEKVLFVDGGILSNFPIDVFHVRNRMPTRPTFGVKIGLDRDKLNEVDKMDYKSLIFTSFNAARMMRDADFIMNNPDFHQLVAHIEIGEHNWLDFDLTEEDKVDLFIRGAKEAAQFLKKFDWKAYKEVRKGKLMTIASEVLGHNIAFFQDMLIEAEKNREVRPRDKKQEKKQLIERLKVFEVNATPFNVLWIDDSMGDEKEYELKVIDSIQGSVTYANSSKEALELLETNNFSFDMIISDIKRKENETEGIEFIYNIWKEYNDKVPPTIYYITNFDPALGTPAYAFGITNSPVELIHLIMDVLQRK